MQRAVCIASKARPLFLFREASFVCEEPYPRPDRLVERTAFALRCSGGVSAADADRDADSASRKPTEAARLARLALAQARSNLAVMAVLPC